MALEYKNAGQLDAAEQTFSALIAAKPDYTASYLHAGNVLVALGRREEARSVYETGIAACRRVGDAHAESELRAALDSTPASPG